jgi:hypothetical protein
MRITITERDNEILNFVESYGSITIDQCKKIYCTNCSRGDVIARRRLSKLVQFDKLKVGKDKITNQNVYYMDKKLSFHDLLSISYYAKLIESGSRMSHFKRVKQWSNELKSDAFICHHVGNEVMFDILEVVRTHAPDLDKYKRLYDSTVPQKYCSAMYKKLTGKDTICIPRLILIDEVRHKKPLFINQDVDIIQLDFEMRQIAKIYLPIAK